VFCLRNVLTSTRKQPSHDRIVFENELLCTVILRGEFYPFSRNLRAIPVLSAPSPLTFSGGKEWEDGGWWFSAECKPPDRRQCGDGELASLWTTTTNFFACAFGARDYILFVTCEHSVLSVEQVDS